MIKENLESGSRNWKDCMELKLENLITEKNSQFKDPRAFSFRYGNGCPYPSKLQTSCRHDS